MSTQALTIVAVGDLSFNGRYHGLLDRYGPDYPLRSVLPHWHDADLRLGNLESPLTARPKVSPPKCTLRGAPRAIDTLQRARFDFVSVANNHMMDFGPEGLAETCERLDSAGIPHAGAGRNSKAARAPRVLVRDGHTIGLLAYCDVEQESPLYADVSSPGVAPLRSPLCLQQVRELRPLVDWLIVQLHWGTEMAQIPSPVQRDLARQFVDAGADLLLGHHPHVLQPMEIINGVPVIYSLGNFLFSDQYWRGRNDEGEAFVSRFRPHPLCRKTGWMEIVLRKRATPQVRFHPAVLTRDFAVVPDDSVRRQREWNTLNSLLNANDYGVAYQAEHCRANSRLNPRNLLRSLAHRVELKLFSFGLIPNAVEGT